MTTENQNQMPAATEGCAAAAGSERLEALRLQLCSIGLHPLHHETPEKAAEAACEMIAYFRRENLDPPHHLQCAVLRKLRVFGRKRALASLSAPANVRPLDFPPIA